MVKTRRQITTMESEQNTNVSQPAQNVENNVAARSIEMIPHIVEENLATTSYVTDFPTQTVHQSENPQEDWLKRFEILFANMSQQINNLQTSTHATNNQISGLTDQINHLQANTKHDLELLQNSTKQQLDRLEEQQNQIAAQMITRDEFESRFKNLESVQQNLPSIISEEVNK